MSNFYDKELSRIINMNYTYVYQKTLAGDRIIEYRDNRWNTFWITDLLKHDKSSIDSRSFIRTKKWLKQNYPELFL